MHQHGLLSARWGECAARQEKFWPFFDLLIDRQKEWSVMSDAVPSFTAIAKATGLNQEQMNACLLDNTVDEAIKKDVEEGQMRQISSTPSYLINHELFVGTKTLKTKLDDALGVKSKEAPATAGK
jgi:protein-disulfide isomerase